MALIEMSDMPQVRVGAVGQAMELVANHMHLRQWHTTECYQLSDCYIKVFECFIRVFDFSRRFYWKYRSFPFSLVGHQMFSRVYALL